MYLGMRQCEWVGGHPDLSLENELPGLLKGLHSHPPGPPAPAASKTTPAAEICMDS